MNATPSPIPRPPSEAPELSWSRHRRRERRSLKSSRREARGQWAEYGVRGGAKGRGEVKGGVRAQRSEAATPNRGGSVRPDEVPLLRCEEMTPRHRRGAREEAANGEGRETTPLFESVEHGPLPEVDLVGEPWESKAPVSRVQIKESVHVRGRELEEAESPVEKHVQRLEVLGCPWDELGGIGRLGEGADRGHQSGRVRHPLMSQDSCRIR